MLIWRRILVAGMACTFNEPLKLELCVWATPRGIITFITPAIKLAHTLMAMAHRTGSGHKSIIIVLVNCNHEYFLGVCIKQMTVMPYT